MSAVAEKLPVQERKERLTVESCGETHKKDGRPVNEDAMLRDDEHGLYGVFDGMGGHGGGEIASETALQECDRLKKLDIRDVREVGPLLERLLRNANREIREKAAKAAKSNNKKERETADMRTTASVVKLHETADGALFAGIATVGDSPVYLWKEKDRQLVLVSETDDLFAEGPNSEYWRREAFRRADLSKPVPTDDEVEFARTQVRNALSSDELSLPARFLWDRRNVVSQSLGVPDEKLRVNTAVVRLEKGDLLMIMTDGVSDNTVEEGDGGLAHIAGGNATTQQKTAILFRGAVLGSRQGKDKNFRAKPDDASIIIVEVK